MSLLTIPYSFTAGTLIQSAQVNTDFSAVAGIINGNIDTTNIGPAGINISKIVAAGTAAASGYVVLPNGIYLQWATVSSVAADGSAATAVTFPVSFPTACFVVIPAIKNAYQTNAWELTVQFDTPSKTGCNVNVAGSPASSTVAVTYIAIGN